MKLRFLSGHYQGRIIDLKTSGLSIGRGQENDLVLEGDGASRHHANVRFISGRWLLEDMDSTNGTRVNGDRISGTRPLQAGDRIGIGDHVMLFSDDNAVADPGNTSAIAAAAAVKRPMLEQLPMARIGAVLAMLVLLATLVTMCSKTDSHTEPAAASLEQPQPDQVEPAADQANLDFLASQEAALREDLAMDEIVDFTELAQAPAAPDDAGAVVAPPPAPVQPPPNLNTVVIATEPVQALLLVDGQRRGTTPIVLRDLAQGRHELELRADGYEVKTHTLFIPTGKEQLQIKLDQAPGSLWVRSIPPGASVRLGTQVMGTTPLLLRSLPDDAEHELTFLLHGYEPLQQMVRCDPQEPGTVEVTLQSRLGSLAVRTSPPDCRVLVDNAFKGITVPADHKALSSKVLQIHGLIEGEHWLAIEHPAGPSRRYRVQVKRGETTQQALRLWIPNAKLELVDGTSKIGMLMDINEHGDVVLAETVQRIERYLKPQIVTLERLDAGSMQNLIAKNPDFATGGIELPDLIAAKNLLEECNTLSAIDLGRKYSNRTLNIEGKLTAIGEEANQAFVTFGDKIRCYFSPEQFKDDQNAIIAAHEVDTALTIKGNVIGVMAGRLVLRECAVKSDE